MNMTAGREIGSLAAFLAGQPASGCGSGRSPRHRDLLHSDAPDEFEIDWESHYRTFECITLETRERLAHQLDIFYGEDAKQRLDAYFPAAKPSAAPVLVFLHGGGNREGDRLQYGYVSEPFAAEGYAGVFP